jgi:hypothetical protein
LASNNWWGHPSGPTPDTPACGSGLGDEVTDGVLFRPVLTSTVPVLFPLTDAPYLTLTPRRWFAPADGISRVYFDITLRDGDGQPLPGREVTLDSTRGAVTDGGLTDAAGHTLAYLVSGSTGLAEVRAMVNDTACEGTLSPTSDITFDPPVAVTDLFPDAPASYFDGRIGVSPMPVVVGVPSTISATLTNPLTVPITVDISFGFAQSGIGLAFGPIAELTGQAIPASSSRTFSVPWIPPVSGHYCLQVTYAITAIGAGGGHQALGSSSGLQRLNLDALPGALSKALVKDYVSTTIGALQSSRYRSSNITTFWNVVVALVTHDEAHWLTWKTTQDGLRFANDPPRQDYDQVTQQVSYTVAPMEPGPDLPATRAAAINAVTEALAEVRSLMEAVALANDRYAGASEAHDLYWAAQQANTRLYYEQQLGPALMQYAQSLENLVQTLSSEGITQVIMRVEDVVAYQQRVATKGFTPEEIAAAHLAGLTDDEIEAYRQELLAVDPDELAGDLIPSYLEIAAASRELGLALLIPYAYNPGVSVSGGIGQQFAAAPSSGNSMVQLSNTTATIQLANPLSSTAVIDVKPRRIDLPADWMVSVSPAQVNLAPGEQITVTVNIEAGSPLPQGSKPSVAVEGYAGSQLLGGVVVQVLAPNYVFFDGNLRLYLPLLNR